MALSVLNHVHALPLKNQLSSRKVKTVVVLPCDLRLECVVRATEMKLNNDIDPVEL